jgi:lysophospholipase L1-like esterase
LEKLYKELKADNLYYIKGEDIVTEWDYLTSDLLHPSPYGHGEMGRKIAKIIREEFKIF